MSNINKRLDDLEQSIHPGRFILVNWENGKRYTLDGRDLTKTEYDELRTKTGCVVLDVVYSKDIGYDPEGIDTDENSQ